jgi:hypothetical protein
MSAVLALALAAAAAEAPPICTDRPAKANAICTVPAGRFQLESSAVGWSRTETGGVTSETVSVGSSVIKYGLSDRSDLQLAFTPYVRIEAKEAGEKTSLSGFGDVTLRYKHRLTADGAPVGVALIPFAKIPTAKRGIGNRKLEGGVAVPVSFGIGGGVTATLGPELDLLADADGQGRHLAVVNLVNLSAQVAQRLTVAGEMWSNLNFDPAGTVRQASADAALAYALSDNVQIDAGANAGLTRATPDIELYAGLSVRF